jgi:Ca2+-binding RTX toxin-like protein
MLSVTPARIRGRTLGALLAAGLATAILPAAAQAESFVGFGADRDLFYSDTSAASNDVLVRLVGNEISIRDTARVSTAAPCRALSSIEVLCPNTARSIQLGTFDGNDTVEYRARHKGSVHLGDGVDTVFGGRREGSGQSIEPVTYAGGADHDKISYAGADRGVSVTPEDGKANDGRTGFGDNENVDTTFEEFIGSNFSDAPLFGTAHTDLMDGGPGTDQIAGGGGSDVFLASPGDGTDDYHGGPGIDSILYFRYSTPVNVSLDNVANDGAAGERDQVRSNVENLSGGSGGDTLRSFGAFSRLDGNDGVDTLDGGSGPDTLVGGQGDDTLDGGTENDLFEMGASADGADEIRGGGGTDTVRYAQRTRPINATLNFDGADDGEAGEGDELVGSNEIIIGGLAGDTIRAPDGSLAAHTLTGGGGIDTLEGADGPDTLDGGSRGDTLLAEGGADSVFAADGEGDTVGCGAGIDTAQLDNLDGFSSCENRSVVGTLRLTPKTVKAQAGKPASVRLSWRHPVSWRKLRTVELRLTRDGAPVGEVTIRPRTGRIGADGAVELVRKQSGLSHKGKTVTARLALRLDESLGGQTLTSEVEATDTRGARQLERDAATVRVAR